MSYAPPPEGRERPEPAAAQPAPPAPQYTPDGRWYWDGLQWRPVPAPGPPWARPYGPPEGRAAAAVALVALELAGVALTLLGEVLDLASALLGTGSAVAVITTVCLFLGGLASIAGVVGAAIAVPMWMHRAFRNLPALGATDLRWSPGWAAGAWFIPLASLVIPFLVARELWARAGGQPAPPWQLMPVWWAAWVAGQVLGTAGAEVNGFSRTAGDVLLILSDLGLVLAGLLLIAIVQRITRRQRARHAQLAGA